MSLLPALTADPAPLAHEVALVDPTAYELLRALEEAGSATRVSLQLPGVDWDSYETLGSFFGEIMRRTAWYIGDWLNHGRDNFGEEYAQVSAITGLSESTLIARAFVCENVPEKRRIEGVPFSHHALVARLKPEEQTRWLKLSQKKGLTYAELKERMKAVRKDTKPTVPGLEAGEPDPEMLLEVARSIIHDAHRDPSDEGYYRIPEPLIVRLTAALGMET